MPFIVTTQHDHHCHATVTRADARQYILNVLGEDFCRRMFDLHEPGQHVDVTIDVRRVGWDHFGQFAQCQARPLEHQQILDAYNG